VLVVEIEVIDSRRESHGVEEDVAGESSEVSEASEPCRGIHLWVSERSKAGDVDGRGGNGWPGAKRDFGDDGGRGGIPFPATPLPTTPRPTTPFPTTDDLKASSNVP
jgi:hypothetical protein